MIRTFTAITAFMADTDRTTCRSLTFADVCRRFKADVMSMNNMFYDTFGMSGEEVMEQFRCGGMNGIAQKPSCNY